jgi:thioredoxin 1
MSLDTTDQNFESDVLGSDEYVLVDFWAEWCGPCKQLAPIIDEVANDMKGSLKVCKVNIDQNPETPSKYNVRGIPTLVIFKNGEAVATKVGSLPKSSLVEWIESTTNAA